MSQTGQILQDCQIVEELSANDGFVSYRVTCPDIGSCRLLLAHPQARLAVKGNSAFFERAEQLSQLDVPGIATVIEAGFYQERLACLLPLCAGQPLYDYMAQQRSIGDVLTLVRALVDALCVVHQRGMCHGNLTPALILVNEQQQPELCDFALSQLFVLDYNSGVDPRYCSPEQVRGEVATPASDIYNLGCILYRLLSGNPPYRGKNNFSIATRHLEGEFPALPESVTKCSDLISAMVPLIPSRRITAVEVLNWIDRLLSDDELSNVLSCEPEDISIVEFSASYEEQENSSQEPLSSISSRVEELLKDQNFVMPEPEDDSNDTLDALPAPAVNLQRPSSSGLYRRYVVLLLLGVVLGMSAFLGYSYWQDSSLDSSSASVPVFPVASLDDALQAWGNKKTDVAEDGLELLIAEHPDDPRAYNNLAAFYAAQGDLDNARKLLERGLRTNTEYLTIHQNLGSVYAEMARESYGKALQLNAEERTIPLQVFSSQGLFLLQRKQSGAADDSTLLALEDVPSVNISESVIEAGESVESQEISEPSPVETSAEGDVALAEAEPTEAVEKLENVPEEISEPSPVVVPQADTAIAQSKEVATNIMVEVQQTLENWAAAWADHDVERYLSFYADSFRPAGGIEKVAWEKQRRRRLQAPGAIQISLSEINIVEEGSEEIVVELLQTYQSERYSDVTRKQFELMKSVNGLKIVRENALEIMR